MKIYALITDIFFTARIRETARHAGADVRFFTTAESLHQAITQESPGLVLVDLSQQSLDPVEVVRGLKRSPATSDTPVLGYLSHVDFALQQQARGAGIDKVVPRSEFTARLSEILTGKI